MLLTVADRAQDYAAAYTLRARLDAAASNITVSSILMSLDCAPSPAFGAPPDASYGAQPPSFSLPPVRRGSAVLCRSLRIGFQPTLKDKNRENIIIDCKFNFQS